MFVFAKQGKTERYPVVCVCGMAAILEIDFIRLVIAGAVYSWLALISERAAGLSYTQSLNAYHGLSRLRS